LNAIAKDGWTSASYGCQGSLYPSVVVRWRRRWGPHLIIFRGRCATEPSLGPVNKECRRIQAGNSYWIRPSSDRQGIRLEMLTEGRNGETTSSISRASASSPTTTLNIVSLRRRNKAQKRKVKVKKRKGINLADRESGGKWDWCQGCYKRGGGEGWGRKPLASANLLWKEVERELSRGLAWSKWKVKVGLIEREKAQHGSSFKVRSRRK